MTFKPATETPGLDRRTLLKRGAIAAGASLVWTGCGPQETMTQPEQAKNLPRNMQLSLAAYSVREALTEKQMTLFEFIEWCAEMDLPGTELTSYYFEEGFDAGYLRELRNRAFRSGVTISGTAIRNNFCLPPGPEKDKEVEQVREWIDHAAELFAPHVRIFAGNVPEGASKEEAIQWTADGVLQVLDRAAERGVVIGLENHGGITALATDLLEICRKVGEHPWFGVNLDTGNYRENPYEEVAQTAPLAVNVQIKVAVRENGKSVAADFARIRDILVESGYRGWVALEYEAEDPFVEVPGYIQQLKGLFEA